MLSARSTKIMLETWNQAFWLVDSRVWVQKSCSKVLWPQGQVSIAIHRWNLKKKEYDMLLKCFFKNSRKETKNRNAKVLYWLSHVLICIISLTLCMIDGLFPFIVYRLMFIIKCAFLTITCVIVFSAYWRKVF